MSTNNSTKSKLKKAKTHLQNEEYHATLELVYPLVSSESISQQEKYLVHLYYALALFKLENYEDSEKNYIRSIDINPDTYPALVGLSNLYEDQLSTGKYRSGTSSSITSKLLSTWEKLSKVYIKEKESIKFIDLILKIARKYEDISDRMSASKNWRILLSQDIKSDCGIREDVNVYELLDLGNYASYLPSQQEILKKILDLEKIHCSELAQREVQKRRYRLGAPPLAVIKLQVDQEIYSETQLFNLYRKFLSMSKESSTKAGQSPDEASRDQDSRRKYQIEYLELLQKRLHYTTDRNLKCEIMNEMTMISKSLVNEREAQDFQPVEFLLNSSDIATVDDLDFELGKKYLQRYPNRFLARFFQVLMQYKGKAGELAEALENLKSETKEDNLLMYFALAETLYDSGNGDLNGALAYCNLGLKLLEKRSEMECLKLPLLETAFNLILANCYLQNSDKEARSAIKIFRKILENDSSNIDALYGLSMAFDKLGNFNESTKCLNRCLELVETLGFKKSSDFILKIKFALSWSLFNERRYEDALEAIEKIGTYYQKDYLYHHRLGRILWEKGEENRRNKSICFEKFIQSAKLNPDFDLNFLYLGHFYAKIENDTQRAKKCYKKAFDSNPSVEVGMILARLYLQEDNDEESAASIYQKIVSVDRRAEWAWIRLGAYYAKLGLNGKAISCFQSALRVDFKKSNTWILLGLAYKKEGRFIAASKAFLRALQIDDNSVVSIFNIGIIYRILGNYEKSISFLKNSLDFFSQSYKRDEHDTIPFLFQIGKSYLSFSRNYQENGLYGLFFQNLLKTIQTFISLTEIDPYFAPSWVYLGDSFQQLSFLKSLNANDAQNSELESLLSKFRCIIKENFPKLEAINFLEFMNEDIETMSGRVLSCSCECYNICLKLLQKKIRSRKTFSRILSCMSWSFYQIYRLSQNPGAIERAISLAKWGIKIDPKSSNCWNALGIYLIKKFPVFAQHSFIQSLEISRSHVVMANLAIFYASQEDLDLSFKALKEAQTIEPEYYLPWYLSGILNSHEQKSESSLLNLKHARELCCGTESQVNYTLARSLFTDKKNTRDYLLALEAIKKYLEVNCMDVSALNLAGLISESLECFGEAEDFFKLANNVSSLQKVTYSEKTAVLKNYARLLCENAKYEESIKIFKEISSDNVDVCSLIAMGLSQYFLNDNDLSLETFQTALVKSNEQYKFLVQALLAQILISTGIPDNVKASHEILLGCFKENPEFVNSIKILAAAAILEDNWSVSDAILNEVSKMHFSPTNNRHEHSSDLYFLQACRYLRQGNSAYAYKELLKSLHQTPWNQKSMVQLVSLKNKTDESLKSSYSQLKFLLMALSKFDGNDSDLAQSQCFIEILYLTKRLEILSKSKSWKKNPKDSILKIQSLWNDSRRLVFQYPHKTNAWICSLNILKHIIWFIVNYKVLEESRVEYIDICDRFLRCLKLKLPKNDEILKNWCKIYDFELLLMKSSTEKQSEEQLETLFGHIEKLDSLIQEDIKDKCKNLKASAYNALGGLLNIVGAEDQAQEAFKASLNYQ